MAIERFEQLEVWKKLHDLVLKIYKATQRYPPEERLDLTSQMRRAAVSIPANIAEGFKRRSQRDQVHFHNIAQASLEELRYYFILSRDLGLSIQFTELDEQATEGARMLSALIRTIESRMA